MTGGKVISPDVHPGKQEYARAALLSAGLADVAEFKLGNVRSIAALSGPIDFVLVDLRKGLYLPCFELSYPKLGSGATVVADNMIFPEFSRRDVRGLPPGRAREGRPTCNRYCCWSGADQIESLHARS